MYNYWYLLTCIKWVSFIECKLCLNKDCNKKSSFKSANIILSVVRHNHKRHLVQLPFYGVNSVSSKEICWSPDPHTIKLLFSNMHLFENSNFIEAIKLIWGHYGGPETDTGGRKCEDTQREGGHVAEVLRVPAKGRLMPGERHEQYLP